MDHWRRIRPLDALRALGRLRRDPENSRAVSEVLEALEGPFFEGWFRRFRATRVGQRVLDQERDLLALLADRAWLLTLPDGSLGRAYVDRVEHDGLLAEGGAEAGRDESGVGWESRLGDQRTRFADRLRDQHELEHVVTGYGRDVLGEMALRAFDLGQRMGLGAVVLVALGLLESDPVGRRSILEAFRRGRSAAWLPATDWESLLELPLVDVRALLGMGAPPTNRVAGSERTSAAA